MVSKSVTDKITMLEKLRKIQKKAPRKHKNTLDVNESTKDFYHSGFIVHVPKMQSFVREFVKRLKAKRNNAVAQDQPPSLAIDTETRQPASLNILESKGDESSAFPQAPPDSVITTAKSDARKIVIPPIKTGGTEELPVLAGGHQSPSSRRQSSQRNRLATILSRSGTQYEESKDGLRD